MLNGRKEQSMGRITKCYRRETKQKQGIYHNFVYRIIYMIYTMKIENLLIPVFLSPAAINAENLPNIVFVLVDDMGIGDINCYYSQPKIQTPNIDKLTSKSLQFMQHYSGSTVSADRKSVV